MSGRRTFGFAARLESVEEGVEPYFHVLPVTQDCLLFTRNSPDPISSGPGWDLCARALLRGSGTQKGHHLAVVDPCHQIGVAITIEIDQME